MATEAVNNETQIVDTSTDDKKASKHQHAEAEKQENKPHTAEVPISNTM
jgi:hypothetical protein